MKLKHVLAVLILAGMAQASMAHSNVNGYPLAPVLDAQPVDGAVRLYFGDAPHPAVVSEHGEVKKSVRIARKTDGEAASCNAALTDGLNALRSYALDHGANGVINIETSFHSTKSSSSTEFTCGTSLSAAALKIRGDLVTLDAK
jgi:uncharacterized protein YbjQ (UPF0145 family)